MTLQHAAIRAIISIIQLLAQGLGASILLHGGLRSVLGHSLEQRLTGSCIGEPLLQGLGAGGQVPPRRGSIPLHSGHSSKLGHGLEQRLHGSCVGEPPLQAPAASGQIPQSRGGILQHGGHPSVQRHGLGLRLHGSCASAARTLRRLPQREGAQCRELLRKLRLKLSTKSMQDGRRFLAVA